MGSAPSGWQTPKTSWQSADVVGASDLSRIEQNISSIEMGNRTIDPTQAPTGNVGSLRQILDWLANRIKAITGATNWYDAPATTLAAAASHISASAPHSGHIKRGTANTDVEQVMALLLQVDTRTLVLTYDANGRLSQVEEKDGSTTVKTTTLTYDSNGRLSQVQESAGGKTVAKTLSYDTNGNLTGITKAVS